jgi:hypothetical protein
LPRLRNFWGVLAKAKTTLAADKGMVDARLIVSYTQGNMETSDVPPTESLIPPRVSRVLFTRTAPVATLRTNLVDDPELRPDPLPPSDCAIPGFLPPLTPGHPSLGNTGLDDTCEFHRPFVVSIFSPITNQGRTLATIDESQVPFLEAALALLATVPQAPAGARRSAVGDVSRFPSQPGPKGRKVMVVSVNTDEYGGDLKHGDSFDTAMAASKALGYKYNAVSMAFNREGGGGQVVMGGVKLQYEDAYMAERNADVHSD